MGNAGLVPEFGCCNHGGDPKHMKDCQVVVHRSPEKVGMFEMDSVMPSLQGPGKSFLSCDASGICLESGAEDKEGSVVTASNMYWSGPGLAGKAPASRIYASENSENVEDEYLWSAKARGRSQAVGMRPMQVCSSEELQDPQETARIDPWTRYAQSGVVKAPKGYLADTFDDGVIIYDQDPLCAGHVHISEERFLQDRLPRRPLPCSRQEWRHADHQRIPPEAHKAPLLQETTCSSIDEDDHPMPTPAPSQRAHTPRAQKLVSIFSDERIKKSAAVPEVPVSRDAPTRLPHPGEAAAGGLAAAAPSAPEAPVLRGPAAPSADEHLREQIGLVQAAAAASASSSSSSSSPPPPAPASSSSLAPPPEERRPGEEAEEQSSFDPSAADLRRPFSFDFDLDEAAAAAAAASFASSA
eukprot:CAMPEP_0203920898 /NCGR_PEP_ID=MMETSP0359-20131031/61126_1 /ASSEMBLY_ACC=CAM_ASM_000338 /TAXON_ID=268821 /ORGANISM="Scrippsiella Hangoei, Strain SHTV-5" /LENGTH=411 /DNA_ID=CAMNT_0050848481 /DNA_START=68 /DNA_END=1299 /DNA_ORIENTATION=+